MQCLGLDGRVIANTDFREISCGDAGLIQIAQRLSSVADSCEEGTEPAVPIKGAEFLDHYSLYQYPKAREQHVHVVAACCLNQ